MKNYIELKTKKKLNYNLLKKKYIIELDDFKNELFFYKNRKRYRKRTRIDFYKSLKRIRIY